MQAVVFAAVHVDPALGTVAARLGLLVDHGYDLDARGARSLTAMEHLLRGASNVSHAMLLANAGASVSLDSLCRLGLLDELLLRTAEDPARAAEHIATYIESLLTHAAANGHVGVLSYLHENSPTQSAALRMDLLFTAGVHGADATFECLMDGDWLAKEPVETARKCWESAAMTGSSAALEAVLRQRPDLAQGRRVPRSSAPPSHSLGRSVLERGRSMAARSRRTPGLPRPGTGRPLCTQR